MRDMQSPSSEQKGMRGGRRSVSFPGSKMSVTLHQSFSKECKMCCDYLATECKGSSPCISVGEPLGGGTPN